MENFTNGNITMASMIKIPMHLRNFSPMLWTKLHLQLLVNYPTKVKIPMTISNYVPAGPKHCGATSRNYRGGFMMVCQLSGRQNTTD
jgi:hypothetical protein